MKKENWRENLVRETNFKDGEKTTDNIVIYYDYSIIRIKVEEIPEVIKVLAEKIKIVI